MLDLKTLNTMGHGLVYAPDIFHLTNIFFAADFISFNSGVEHGAFRKKDIPDTCPPHTVIWKHEQAIEDDTIDVSEFLEDTLEHHEAARHRVFGRT